MAEPLRCPSCRRRLVRGHAGYELWCPSCNLPLVECGCGDWFVQARPEWETCLHCEGPPEGTHWVSRPAEDGRPMDEWLDIPLPGPEQMALEDER